MPRADNPRAKFAKRDGSLAIDSRHSHARTHAHLLLRLDTLAHVIAAYHVLSAERAGRILLILVNGVLRVPRQAAASVRPYLDPRTLGQICAVALAGGHPGDHRPRQPYLFFFGRRNARHSRLAVAREVCPVGVCRRTV